MNRSGFYVDGRRFSFDHKAQALARAEFLASTYGRSVSVILVNHDFERTVVHTAVCDTSASTRLLVCGIV